MNAHDMLSHDAAAQLLPWLVNDSLDEMEKSAVLAHARACVICRREMSELEKLRDAIGYDAKELPQPEPDMRRINARIDAAIGRRNPARRFSLWIRDLLESHWRIALLAQTVLLLTVTSYLFWPNRDLPEFSTLTEVSQLPGGLYVRLVFSPDLAPAELSGLLESFDLRVVDGPSRRGVFTLGMAASSSADDRDNLLAVLQQDPRVLFAQPVTLERTQ